MLSNTGASPSIRLHHQLTAIRLERVLHEKGDDMGSLDHLMSELAALRVMRHAGRIVTINDNVAQVGGLSDVAAIGDIVAFGTDGDARRGEVIAIGEGSVTVLPEGAADRLRMRDRVMHLGPATLQPCDAWVGRVIDPFGKPLDGVPLPRGGVERPLSALPPPPLERRGLGARLETGLCLFNTILPLVRGQRIGLFAGAGVGKTTLLAQLARGIEADVVVIALVGERGREVRDFLARALGPEGRARAVVVAATSDNSHMARRRCLPAAMTVAEHFRDAGKHVLLLADSITRFVEAHREIALSAGEKPVLDGYPPSIVPAITSLCERAGPGRAGSGDITAILSVLMAGSDADGVVADTMRGVLDGHIVLERGIAERGRFPAVDVLRSVSRSLPEAAGPEENALIAEVRSILSVHERSEVMVQAGLHVPGADPAIDRALALQPRLDAFFGGAEHAGIAASFAALGELLQTGRPSRGAGGGP
jgi:flagellum-specific ATP synthase